MCPDKTAPPVFADIKKSDINMMSGLTLAFAGDSVYDLMIRSHILSQGDAKAELLHRRAVKYANAEFQARAAERLLPLLNDAEQAVYRRGRNAHSAHTPKNKSEADYHKATGFEALFGYLYLNGQTGRLEELFGIVLNTCEVEENDEQKKARSFITPVKGE